MSAEPPPLPREFDPPPLSAPIYKIANAALWCLAGAFVVNFFFGGVASAASEQGYRIINLVISMTIGLLMLLSVVFGAIALCGIRKYGKKRLLWKGLVGVFLPIFLVFAALPAFLKVKALSQERARQQQHQP